MEKYILTGATGHLGTNLVKMLLKQDCEIKVLVLENDDVSSLKNTRIKIAFGNVLDREFLNKEIESDSTVIHMAGIIDITSADKSLLYRVNVEGTKNVAEICLNKKVKKLIYTSSVHVIKPIKNQILAEPNIFDETQIVGDYAKSKTMAVKNIFELRKKGLNLNIVYPSGIIGPNDARPSDFGQLLLDIANKKIKARVNGGYNFVDVRDVCEGIIAIAKTQKAGEDFILSGNVVSIDEVFTIINNFLKRKKFPPKLATWFVKLFAPLAEKYYKVRGEKPLFTKYSLYTITSNHNFSNQKAQTQLQLSPRSAKDSIEDALIWFCEHKPEFLTEETKQQIEQIIKDRKY